MKNKEQVTIDNIFEKNDFIKGLKLTSPRLVSPRIKTSKQLKDQEQQRVLNLQFDEFDSEETEQLDIFQLRLFLESGKFPISSNRKLFVKEQNLRELLGSMFLEKSSRITRKEFLKFCNYFEQKRDEIEWNKVSLITTFSHIDLTNVTIKFNTFQQNEIIRYDLVHNQRLNKENVVSGVEIDSYHSLIMEQFYQQTSTLLFEERIDCIDSEERILKSNVMVEPGKYNRREVMPSLFGVIYPELNPSDLFLTKVIEESSNKTNNIIYVVDLSDVVWGIGFIDNLLLSFSIYDLNKNEKVTSNFVVVPKQVDVNSLVSNNVGETCAIILNETQTKNDNLWAVLMIYKLFDGEGMDEVFAAEKETRSTSKLIEKMRQINVTQKSKGVQFYQYVATGLMAFNNDLNEDRKSYYNLKLYFDEGINDLNQILKNIETGKTKAVNGSWGFKFEKLTHYSKASLIITQDGVVQNVDSQPPESSEKENEEIPLLYNLSSLKNSNDIYHDFYNTLFISPLEIIIPKDKKTKNGGISLMFQLKTKDDLNESSVIKAFYPTNSMSSTLLDRIYSSVIYGKQTLFNDEIRVKLPFPLKEKYHLLITIYYISNEDFSQKPIYYAALPLFANGNVVSSMQFSLPLLKGELKPDYLGTIHQDVSKTSISIKIDVQSTVYPKEKNVYRFLNGKMMGMERALESIPVQEAIHFLPSIVNYFIYHTKDDSLGFYALFDVFARIEGGNKSEGVKSKLLVDFTNNYTVEDESLLVSKILWQFLMKTKDEMENVENVFKYSWIIFTILMKGMVMLHNSGKKMETKSLSYLSIGCQKYSSLLRKTIVSNNFKGVFDGNINLAEFLGRAIGIIDDEFITSVIVKHLTTLGSCIGQDGVTRLDKAKPPFVTLGICRIQFIGSLGLSNNFILFNKPQPLEVKTIETLGDEITEKHFVITYFIRELLNIFTREGPVGKIAIDTLFTIIIRFDFDIKYQSKEDRNLIANSLFGLLIYLLDEFEKIKDIHYNQFNVSDECINDLKVMYLCMFFVLKNISYSTMKSWIEKEIPTRIEVFLIHLRRALLLFTNFPIVIPNPIEEINDLVHTLKQSFSTQSTNRNTMKIEPLGTLTKTSTNKLYRFSGALNTLKRNSIVQKKITKTRDSSEIKASIQKLTEEVSAIVMDYAEALFDRFEESIDNGSSLVRLEEIVSTTLFLVQESDEYTTKLNDFIRLLILRHKHFLFEGTTQFSGVLIKNLLNLCNSTQQSTRKNALDLVYTMVKYNFIFSQNINRSMSDCVVSLSELKYNDTNEFKNLFKSLPSLAKQDFESSVKLIDDLRHIYWEEGQKNISFLVHLQKINIGVGVGDLDVFIVFMNGVLNRFMKVIDLLNGISSTSINHYDTLKRELINEIGQAMLFSQDDINALENINNNVGKGLEEMRNKINDCLRQYSNVQTSIKDQQQKIKQEQEKNEKTRKSLGEMESFFNHFPQWLSNIIQIADTESQLENEKPKWIEWAEDISSLNEVERINYSNFETLVELINYLKEDIKNAQKTDIEQTNLFDSLSQIMENKMAKGIGFIDESYKDCMKDIFEIDRREYDENCFRVIEGLMEYSQTLEMKMAKMRTDLSDSIDHYCSFEWWCKTIESGKKLFSYVIELSERYEEMKESIFEKEQWHLKEVKYGQEVLKAYIWSSIGSELSNIRMRESNDYVVAIASISKKAYLKKPIVEQYMKDAQIDYNWLRGNKEQKKNVISLSIKSNTKRRDRKKRRYTVSTISVMAAIHHFEEDMNNDKFKLDKIKEVCEEFEKQAAVEIQCEQIRKDYAVTLQYLFTATEPFIQQPKMITQAVIKDVQTLSQRLIQAEVGNDKYIKLNRYVDYSICKEPHQARVSKIMSLFSDKLLGSIGNSMKKTASGLLKKKPAHSLGGSKKMNQIIEKGNRFVDINGDFIKDAFIDVSKSQQLLFERCLNELTTSSDQILQKLMDIENLMNGNSSMQLVEKFMMFSKEYQNTARVHIAWVQRMIEEYLSNKLYCEAAMCCIHIVLYLGLPDNIDKKKLLEICEEPICEDPTLEMNKEILPTIISKLKQATEYFSLSGKTNISIGIVETLINIFQMLKQYKELELCHENMCELYGKLENDSANDYYYLIGRNGNHLGYVIRSLLQQPQFEQTFEQTSDQHIYQVIPMKNGEIVKQFISTNTFCLEHEYENDDNCSKICKKREIITISKPLPSMLVKCEVISIKEIICDSTQIITERLNEIIENCQNILKYGPLPLKYVNSLVHPFDKIDLLQISQNYLNEENSQLFKLIIKCFDLANERIIKIALNENKQQIEMVDSINSILQPLSEKLLEIKKER